MMEYNYTPSQHFSISKNKKKHPKMQKNNKISQLVITNICIHVVNLK